MVTEKVTKVLQDAIQALERERDEIDQKIESMQDALTALGEKKGPGRPRGSVKKRGPGRPKGSTNKRGPGRPPKKKTTTKKKRVWSQEAKDKAAARMRQYWKNRKSQKK